MKTIVLPLDLGAETQPLLNYAVPMAAQFNATLLLLHVIRKQSYDNGTFSPETRVHQRVKQEAEIILNQLSRQTFNRGVRAKVLIQDADESAGDAIVQCAKKAGAELIVMPRARGSETRTSEQVLQKAPCPVLTWRDAAADPVR